MTRYKKHILLALALVASPAAFGFSLLGPYKAWQVTGLGYNLPGDIGAPMDPTEAYRWNVPTVTYAFDQSFVDYFGPKGMAAVDAAFKILNDLPPSSQITNDGVNLYIRGEIVPTDTKRVNYEAQAVGLLDLKSTALTMIVEQLGLAEPERWAWALRGRNTRTVGGVTITNWSTIQLNFDPITRKPTPYVNGVLYSYQIFDPIPNINYADAIELEGDQLAFTFSSVAGGFFTVAGGEFYTGLTHDDVGALKFLLNPNRYATESLLSDVTGSSKLSTFSPWIGYQGGTNLVGGTNVVITTNTTNYIVQGLRPGVNELTFKRVNYDSLIGAGFVPVTNTYSDTVITNGQKVAQTLSRVITQPDILFLAFDLGVAANLVPVLASRTDTSGWINSDAINGQAAQGGPGVIQGQVRLSFSDKLPYYINDSTEDPPEEGTGFKSFIWGSFDGSTNTPTIYPLYQNYTLDDLRRLSGGGRN